MIAAVFEFLGSVLVGANVAEAIRGRIISTSLFSKNPYTLQVRFALQRVVARPTA